MKATVEEKSKTEYLLKIEIPSDIVDQKLEQIFRKVARELQVPGFRRGRVPRQLMEARFGKDFIYEDSQNELISEHLAKVLEEHKLQPVSRPQTKVVQFEQGKPFHLEVEVEILPPVELGDYQDLKVEEPPLKEITEGAIQTVLERFQLQHATAVPKLEEETLEAGDVAVIRLLSDRQRDRTQEVRVTADDTLFAPLLGQRPGDSVELGTDQRKLTVKIEAVKRLELPDTAELSQTMGFESENQLLDKIKQDLAESAARQREREWKAAVLEAVVKSSVVHIPPRLIEELLSKQLEARQEQDLPEPSAEEVQKLRQLLEEQLRHERVLEAIRVKENLTITDEEFDRFLQESAEREGMNLVKFKALLEREGRLEDLRREREREKTLQFLLQSASVGRSNS